MLLDRLLWAWLSRVWSHWRSALAIVQPETVLAWHRRGFGLFWAWKIRRGHPGRPTLPRDVRDLIRSMCRENPTWGASRIHGELLKLGLNIAESCVSKYMLRGRKPPSQTWRTFLENHAQQLVSIDFFTVPTLRCQVLYVFLVLAHDRRRPKSARSWHYPRSADCITATNDKQLRIPVRTRGSGRPLCLLLSARSESFFTTAHFTVLMEDPSVRHTEFSLGTDVFTTPPPDQTLWPCLQDPQLNVVPQVLPLRDVCVPYYSLMQKAIT